MMASEAILIVSYGTSYAEPGEKALGQIEKDIRSAFPDVPVYHAWTSERIRRAVLERDGRAVCSVREAMKQMQLDGVRKLTVQPTYVIPGAENDRMQREVREFEACFEQITFGQPLLTDGSEGKRVILALIQEIQPKKNDALVFVGHGTKHASNAVYAELERQLFEAGYQRLFFTTLKEDSDSFLFGSLHALKPQRVILIPLLMVSGNHAETDLFGADAFSFKSRLEREGFLVAGQKKGLGEYASVRKIILENLKAAMK